LKVPLEKQTKALVKISIKVNKLFSFHSPLSVLFYYYLTANLRTNKKPEPSKTTDNNKIGALSPVGGFSSALPPVLTSSPSVSELLEPFPFPFSLSVSFSSLSSLPSSASPSPSLAVNPDVSN